MTSQTVINVGSAEDFPLDVFRIVEIEGRSVGILRRTDGRVHAVRNWCPHKGAEICKMPPTGTTVPGPPGTLEWAHEGEVLRCPWHGFEFMIEDGVRPYSESRMRLRIYPAQIENGDVLVDIARR